MGRLHVAVGVLMVAPGMAIGATAGGVPEICATSPVMQRNGPAIVYGTNFDDDALAVGSTVLTMKPTEAALRQSLKAAMTGKAVPDGERKPERRWTKVVRKEKHRFLLPAVYKLARDGVHLILTRNSRGRGTPYVANRPEIWATSPRRPVVGQVCQFWGLNLGKKLAVVDRSGKIVFVGDAHQGYHTHSGRVEARFFRGFVVPADLKPGTYRLYNWAGCAAAGWSDALEVELVRRPTVPEHIVRVSDFGAKGDSVHDDTEAFDKAMAAVAKQGGGRVFVGHGRFRITRSLRLPERVHLYGISPEASVLIAGRGTERKFGGTFPVEGLMMPPPEKRKTTTIDGKEYIARTGYTIDWYPQYEHKTVMVWVRSGGGIENLTLDGSATVRLAAMVFISEKDNRPCVRPFVRNCRLVHAMPFLSAGWPKQRDVTGILVASGTDEMEIADNRFRLCGVNLYHLPGGWNYGARILRNHFTTVPPHGAHTLYMPRASNGCLIEANVFDNGGRTKTEQGLYHMNATIQHNCWRLNIIRNSRKGDGETIMYETGSPGWYGRAKGATARTITALDTNRWWPAPNKKGAWQPNAFAGGYCVIVDGRGLGQWGFVVSNTTDTVTLDRAWRIVPDGTTTFSVLKEGSVENVHVSNDVFFSAGYSGNYRTSLRNVWAQNESEAHSMGLKFWNTSSATYVTAYNVAFGERYHSRGGIEIRNAMKFYQEQAYRRKHPDAVKPDNPWHRAWLAAFKSSRRVFGNEVRSCIVANRRMDFTQNGGLYANSIRFRVAKHGLRPERLAGIALTTIMAWPTVDEEPVKEVSALPKTPMSWNLLYDNLLRACPVGIRLSIASTQNFVINNTFLDCDRPVLDLGKGNVVAGSLVHGTTREPDK